MSIRVVYFREKDGSAPVLDWLGSLPKTALYKCYDRIERLRELGHQLRRPEADYLRDGIYELRVRFQTVNYRVLYFFHGREAAILAHAITKEDEIPTKEIALAVERKRRYELNPAKHTMEE